MTARVKLERQEGLAVVYLDNPPINALDERTAGELHAALAAIQADDATRVVVLASKVRYAFCSGLDLDEIYVPGDPERSGANTVRATERAARIAELLVAADKPIVAAIDGIVMGSGVTLALSCDLRVCTDVAQFRLPDVQYGGLLGDGGIHRLQRIAGDAAARELLLLGEKVRAERALATGLVHRVVAEGQELEEALRVARILARRAPRSLAGCKRVLDAPPAEVERVTRSLLREIVRSEDTFEGLRAFAERRPPVFRGR